MKFPVLWSGLCCYTEGWGGKCSEILATIKLLYNPRVNRVFISSIHIITKAYNFKNDFNLDLKSLNAPASTISFDKLFQSLTTLIKKRMFKTVNF